MNKLFDTFIVHTFCDVNFLNIIESISSQTQKNTKKIVFRLNLRPLFMIHNRD